MNKVKKIYGVYGMMEYQAIIKIGNKSSLRVNFTEGSATAIGVTPATYRTDNLMYQHAIEHSADFKSGRIKLLKTMELDEEVYIESEHVALANDESTGDGENAPEVVAPEATGEDDNNEPNDADENDGDVVADDADTAKAETAAEGKTVKEFACVDDAKDFFEQEFGAKRSTLRTKASLIAYGETKGIEVVFTE